MALVHFHRRWLLILLIIFTAGLVTPARADSAAAARIGEIWVQDEAGAARYHHGFADGLRELGYVEGQNLIVLTRYANGDESRLPLILDELIALKVDILFVSAAAVGAAKKATATIPIVCATMNDAVGAGLVASLSRPGGNLTGVTWQSVDTATKRLEFAFELRPELSRLAVLFDSGESAAQREAEVVSSVARKRRVTTVTFEVHRLSDVQAAFASMAKSRPQALYVVDNPFMTGMRRQIAALALQMRVPMISEARSFAEAGAVLTYGAKDSHLLRRGAVYVDKILKGAKPGDLPIEQPTEFELIVNLKAAKALGIRVPSFILERADRVIR